ncbi:MAG: hypothetical protein KGM16_19945 [Bacteroidota bacterium]|nr:hypothetical protein [Bacteroidota bacterium]
MAPEWIVGTDGKKVTYSTNKNGIIWSKNASKDTREIGNAMLLTPDGKKQLNKLIHSDSKIHLKLSNETKITTIKDPQTGKEQKDYLFGITIPKTVFKNPDNTYDVKEQTIIIYKGTITEGIKIDSREKGLSVDEGIGAVAGHESVHAIDKAVINKTYGDKNYNPETKPIEMENKIAAESRMINAILNTLP